jgi:hypothetical protein
MGKDVKWQSVKIDFPKKLYFYAVWIKGDSLIPFFTNVLYKDLPTLKRKAKKLVKDYQKKLEGLKTVFNTILIIPVNYEKDHPLKKSLWQGSVVEFDEGQRLQQFIQAIDKPSLYYLCITPFIEGKESKSAEIKFGTPFPFLKSQEDEIDELMKASDFPVTPKAKNCAIYTFGKAYGYDLEIGEKIDKQDKILN